MEQRKKTYKAFGIELNEGDNYRVDDFYDYLGEHFHNNVNFKEFLSYLADGNFFLYDDRENLWEVIIVFEDTYAVIDAIVQH